MREHVNAQFSQAGFNVTSDQWPVIYHPSQQDGLTQQDLAERCNRSKVAVFNLLKHLEKTGLIMRHPDPVDKRSRRVYLTVEGRRAVTDMAALVNETNAGMTEGISDKEIEVLSSVVTRIIENLR